MILLALVPCSGVVAGQEIATSDVPQRRCAHRARRSRSVFIDANFNHLKDGTGELHRSGRVQWCNNSPSRTLQGNSIDIVRRRMATGRFLIFVDRSAGVWSVRMCPLVSLALLPAWDPSPLSKAEFLTPDQMHLLLAILETIPYPPVRARESRLVGQTVWVTTGPARRIDPEWILSLDLSCSKAELVRPSLQLEVASHRLNLWIPNGNGTCGSRRTSGSSTTIE